MSLLIGITGSNTFDLTEYHTVESVDVDDNKYKRKNPLAMISKWAR